MTDACFEPGSFRDRTNRVFYQDDMVFRALKEQALTEWHALSATAFFQRLMENGKVISTQQVEMAVDLGSPLGEEWSAVLKHQKIPFISYPYEWSFGMLKDAALLQLELIRVALAEEMILQDASFNVQ